MIRTLLFVSITGSFPSASETVSSTPSRRFRWFGWSSSTVVGEPLLSDDEACVLDERQVKAEATAVPRLRQSIALSARAYNNLPYIFLSLSSPNCSAIFTISFIYTPHLPPFFPLLPYWPHPLQPCRLPTTFCPQRHSCPHIRGTKPPLIIIACARAVRAVVHVATGQ